MELLDEIYRLERKKTYYKVLNNKVLLYIVPILRFHAHRLFNIEKETYG